MKKCPHCAEEIQDEAKKCKHCKEWCPIDVHDFIVREGTRIQEITEQFTPRITEALRASGYQPVAVTCDPLAQVWRLEMTKPQPPAIDEIKRILTEIVALLRYNNEHLRYINECFEIKDGLVVTVVLEEHIKSAFCLSQRFPSPTSAR